MNTTFFDDVLVANESLIPERIKDGLVNIFTKLINIIQNKLRQCKDSKLKTTLMSLLHRAKAGLNKSRAVKDPKVAEELKKEADEIQHMIQSQSGSKENEDITEEFKKACDKKNKLVVRIMLKDETLICKNDYGLLNKYVSYASKTIPDLWDEDDGDDIKGNSVTDKYNQLAVACINNFSKKKWNELVKLAKEL